MYSKLGDRKSAAGYLEQGLNIAKKGCATGRALMCELVDQTKCDSFDDFQSCRKFTHSLLAQSSTRLRGTWKMSESERRRIFLEVFKDGGIWTYLKKTCKLGDKEACSMAGNSPEESVEIALKGVEERMRRVPASK